MFKDISNLKIKFIISNLKYRYPMHFEYAITSDNSGYISKYRYSMKTWIIQGIVIMMLFIEISNLNMIVHSHYKLNPEPVTYLE